ncbi:MULTISPECIES: hypothetical protein [Alteromonadales]|uniref:Uncharacterized protein n=1 Tax=Pseudoalteromonas lipolytica TaxID=570156 RepID=A0ABY1GN24_9GAMM|nr:MULTISPECIES: hypothetical protein [Pseudoalteromonas]MBE0353186.1 hypothetical protein [Pseudoalteromonas lipolytica LMEB 39]SFT72705.1 hypothetical protein SAMN04487854_10859 [Pseudoalteromonas lipolytica]
MKEYRFKVLKEGDSLYLFDGKEMIIQEESGNFRVYKVFGFDLGEPTFSKQFEKLTVHSGSQFNDQAIVIEKAGKLVIYKVEDFKNKLPLLNDDFVILLSKGIGKIEVYDSKSRISVQLPAKEGC